MKKIVLTHGEKGEDNSQIHKNPAKALKDAVELRPNDEFIVIQLNGSPVTRTYAQIWEDAERRLGGLRSLGLQPGSTVIFQIDTSQDFAPALWSCIMGGLVPVPVTLVSDYSQLNPSLSILDNIWQQLDDPTILTTAKLASQIHSGLQLYGTKNVKIATIEEIETHSPDTRLHQLQPDELALLLPSSGTTGKTKLIEVNGRSFIYRFLKNAINQNNDSLEKIFLSWFPLESVGGILTTTPNGFQKNICFPIKVLIRNPLLWLDVMSKYQVTHAQTSNFILSLVIEQLRENPQSDWDFSHIQKIGIGAEPIVAKTVRSFARILSPYNLHPNVLCPAYGMTECGPIAGKPAYEIAKSELIAGSREGFSLTNIYDGDRFVEIGQPTKGHSIRIVDQQGSILIECQIGRIQVTGPSMTSGYYKAPELTRELFTEDGWINTGDLGFLKDGKLTITGREKEIVIINARNYSCHEIELIVEEVEGVEPSYTVACAIRQQDSDTDELAIFFHTLITEDSQLAKLAKQIRGKVTQTLGINPIYIIPIEKEAIPRTATGKIQRLQLKQSLEAGEFNAIIKRVDALIKQESEKIFVSPRNELELQLTQIWEKVLGIQPIGIKDNFFDLGGHSLLAVRLVAEIDKAFDKKLPLATLFQAPTVEQLTKIFHNQEWKSSWYSLVPLQPSGSRPPLFGIHHLYFHDLSYHLGSEQPIYGLHYGMGETTDKEISLPTLENLAAHYIQEMRSLQPEGPYYLMGLSFGGVIAYEMAQQLVGQGQQVAFLGLFDTFIEDQSTFLPLHQRFSKLFQLTPSELLRKIKTKIKGKLVKHDNKYLPHVYNPNLLRIMREAYTPQVYSGRVTLFKAMNHTSVTYAITPPEVGWRKFVNGELEIHEVPGSHLGMLEEPNVKILAEKMRACIEKSLNNE
jgi:acyl-CoA synthetase (AMP-forming)/AMP-acid ligase II/thioesterase domain-containing protein/acyl carrier protein